MEADNAALAGLGKLGLAALAGLVGLAWMAWLALAGMCNAKQRNMLPFCVFAILGNAKHKTQNTLFVTGFVGFGQLHDVMLWGRCAYL